MYAIRSYYALAVSPSLKVGARDWMVSKARYGLIASAAIEGAHAYLRQAEEALAKAIAAKA